jgi:hypothetical protein
MLRCVAKDGKTAQRNAPLRKPASSEGKRAIHIYTYAPALSGVVQCTLYYARLSLQTVYE